MCGALRSGRSTITAKVKSEAPASFSSSFFFFFSLPLLCSDVIKLQLHVKENKITDEGPSF